MTTDDLSTFDRLEKILERIETSGVNNLTSQQVLSFGPLYRRAVSALSTARANGVDDARIEYLNALVSRAYGHIYVQKPKGWPSIAAYLHKRISANIQTKPAFHSGRIFNQPCGGRFCIRSDKQGAGQSRHPVRARRVSNDR